MIQRRYPIGAEIVNDGVSFRVWAPDHHDVKLVIENQNDQRTSYDMESENNGYFSLFVQGIEINTLYRYRLSDQNLYTDPASKYQPQGPESPSCVVDSNFNWSDNNWGGVDIQGQIIYELHVGTFTQEGTYAAAINELDELANLGITVIELMPLNDFYGEFGWGYDGVNLFAPCRLYGTPQDLKAFINKAHELGIAVILDVVYNHFGPEGNYLHFYAKDYFTDKFKNDWGPAINYDCDSTREFFLTNAKYWIEEFHFDGLRLDATSFLFCCNEKHILHEIRETVAQSAKNRKTIVIAENEPQDVKLLNIANGYGIDAIWNDDFHHSAFVRLTGIKEAYYLDYSGTPQEFISCLKYGFLFQGQYYEWQKKFRGTPALTLPPWSFITFIENHDQIGNSIHGKRLYEVCDFGIYKVMTTLLLLGPNIPMLFQGQEFGSSSPFLYFADHSPELSKLVYKGRGELLSQFTRYSGPELVKMADPADPTSFTTCKLNFNERNKNHKIYQLHKDLIKLRKHDPVFKKIQKLKLDGAVLNNDAFVIRYFDEEEGDRIIIINFGNDFIIRSVPEPLIACSPNKKWKVLFSTEQNAYGGNGLIHINPLNWKMHSHSAIVLKAISK